MALIDQIRVINSSSISELLANYEQNPEAIPLADGLFFFHRYHSSVRWNSKISTILNLNGIDELRNVKRSEVSIDLGALVSLRRLLYATEKILGLKLPADISFYGNREVKNTISIGSFLVDNNSHYLLLPILNQLNSKIELRKKGANRWLPISALAPLLPLTKSQEILTRIRIPIERWNKIFLYIDESAQKKERFSMAVLFDSSEQGAFLFRIQISDVEANLYKLPDLEYFLQNPVRILGQFDQHDYFSLFAKLPFGRQQKLRIAATIRRLIMQLV